MTLRYRLQESFEPLGPESTKTLAESYVFVVGCGATGSHVVDTLARMGVGFLAIADEDQIEGENLHRQLYGEADICGDKAFVLADHVRDINSDVRTLPIMGRVTPINIQDTIGGEGRARRAGHLAIQTIDPPYHPRFGSAPDLILDCTDNMESRWMINDYSIETGIPWIYAGVGRDKGVVMPILPGKSACLRCLYVPSETKLHPKGGIFPPTIAITASFQASMAIKILMGGWKDSNPPMLVLESWGLDLIRMNVKRNEECPTCGKAYEVGEKVWARKETNPTCDMLDVPPDWQPATIKELEIPRRSATYVEFDDGICGHRMKNEITRIKP